MGDNGAGKSTLIKIISGNFLPDAGEVLVDGARVQFRNPSDARAVGIETVYQGLSLCENLDSAANLFIGRERYRSRLGIRILQNKEMADQATGMLNRLGLHIPSVKGSGRVLVRRRASIDRLRAIAHLGDKARSSRRTHGRLRRPRDGSGSVAGR